MKAVGHVFRECCAHGATSLAQSHFFGHVVECSIFVLHESAYRGVTTQRAV
jgi:hypothetical protein